MSDSLTRREFTGYVVAGSALSVTAAAVEAAQKGAADKPQADQPQPVQPLTPLELTLELVKQKYPHDKLVDAALDEVRSDIRHHLGRSQVLSSHPLLNSDEPGFVFSAWRADR